MSAAQTWQAVDNFMALCKREGIIPIVNLYDYPNPQRTARFNIKEYAMQTTSLDRRGIDMKTRIGIAVSALLFTLVVTTTCASAASGDLDDTFGTSGKITTPSILRGERASGLVIQSDGKIVAAGTRTLSNFSEDFIAIRYASDGSLDTDFGTNGKTTIDFGQREDTANAVALQSNGKIILAGATFSGQNATDFAIARLNADGTLDTDFDEDGRAQLEIDVFEDAIHALIIDSNGKILVAGSTRSSSTDSEFALARFNTDGSLDTTFGNNGTVTLDFNLEEDTAHTLAIDPFGNIFVAGASGTGLDSDIALAKLSRSGQLDTSFGTQGKVTTNLGNREDIAYDMAIDNNGKILIAGVTQSATFGSDIALLRYTAGGSLDTTFNEDGVVLTDVNDRTDVALALAVQSDNKILVAGNSHVNGLDDDTVLIRYESDGDLDTTFNFDGIVLTSFTNNEDIATDIAIQSDDKIVTAGVAADELNSATFALARYLGTDDETPPDEEEEVDVSVGFCFISTIAGQLFD